MEPCPPEIRLRLLDKLHTYDSARACGVAHPRFWKVQSRAGGITEVLQSLSVPNNFETKTVAALVLLSAPISSRG